MEVVHKPKMLERPSDRPSVNIYHGCLVSATPLTFFTDLFETLQMFSSWCKDVHVVWI